jgi:DNA-binding NarL/FixJ family response regulator
MASQQSAALVLIVDPDEDARVAAAEALHRAGYSTFQLENGEKALEVARHERPRVVVLEICLPGISGYEVCRELRHELGESISIVFVSGTRMESYDRVAGLMIGADDYLAKPLAGDELMARVRGLLRREGRSNTGGTNRLTPREHDVIQLLTEGLGQKEIAGRLSISPKTVGTHVEHIFAKLGVRNRAQAVLAYREGLANGTTLRSLALVQLPLHADALADWLGFACAVPLGC